MFVCEVDQAASGIAGIWVALVVANGRDLRSDDGAVRDVVVRERRRPRVGDEIAMPAEETRRQRWGPEPFQVHGEERRVVEDVAPSQFVRELDAVEDAGPVVEQEDVVCLHIAVTIAYPARGDALVEEIGAVHGDTGGRGLGLGRVAPARTTIRATRSSWSKHSDHSRDRYATEPTR